MRALLIVDVQNDFFPGGTLAVQGADQIIPLLDQLVKEDWDVIAATKDWHPKNHGSFAINHPGKKVGEVISLDGIEQILWPVHCLQETEGADFVPGWDHACVNETFYKAIDPLIDSYSAFYDNRKRRTTGLGEFLKEKGVDEVVIVGIATDYCIKYSAFDALELGFEVTVIPEICRSIDLNPGDGDKALEEMRRAGIEVVPYQAYRRREQESNQ